MRRGTKIMICVKNCLPTNVWSDFWLAHIMCSYINKPFCRQLPPRFICSIQFRFFFSFCLTDFLCILFSHSFILSIGTKTALNRNFYLCCVAILLEFFLSATLNLIFFCAYLYISFILYFNFRLIKITRFEAINYFNCFQSIDRSTRPLSFLLVLFLFLL